MKIQSSGRRLEATDNTVRPTELMDAAALADLLCCSTRHLYRLCESAKMPRPIKLGRLVRWRREEIDRWIEQGCPAVRRDR